MLTTLLQLVVEQGEEAQRTVGGIVKDAAAYLLALGVIVGVVWRLLRPHFERLVREAVATRKSSETTRDDLAQLPSKLDQLQRDVARLADLPERVNRLEGRADVLEAALFAQLTGRNPYAETTRESDR